MAKGSFQQPSLPGILEYDHHNNLVHLAAGDYQWRINSYLRIYNALSFFGESIIFYG